MYKVTRILLSNINQFWGRFKWFFVSLVSQVSKAYSMHKCTELSTKQSSNQIGQVWICNQDHQSLTYFLTVRLWKMNIWFIPIHSLYSTSFSQNKYRCKYFINLERGDATTSNVLKKLRQFCISKNSVWNYKPLRGTFQCNER